MDGESVEHDPKLLASEHLTSVLMENRVALVGFVRRLGYSHETAEDAVQTVSTQFLSDLARYDASGLSTDFFTWEIAKRWTPPYLFRSAKNAAARASRHPTYELIGEVRDALTLGEPELQPDAFVEESDRDVRVTAVRVCLRALVDRGSRMKRGTFISPEQWRSYDALRSAAREDAKLATTSAAAAIGVKPLLVSQHRKRIENTLLTTRYVVGVLGARGRLLDHDAINSTLDVFDKQTPKPRRDPLLAASSHVHTTYQKGTRVDAEAYAGDVNSLHACESDFISAVAAAEPNCVLVCAAHTVTADRVTEF